MIPRPMAQVLMCEPGRHMYWVDFKHRCRTQSGLLKQLRHGVRRGKYFGYRVGTITMEHHGLTWPGARALARRAS